MRRCVCSSSSSSRVFAAASVLAGAGTCARSAVHSAAVAKHVPAATTAHKIGVPPTREQVAQAHHVPVSMLDQVTNGRIIIFTQMELARATYAPLIASMADADNLPGIEREVELRFAKDEAKSKPVPGALAKLKGTEWKSLKELVTFYEETMYPIRATRREFLHHQMTSFHIKDVLKRGLTAFKQDFLDQQKQEQTKVYAEMKKLQDFIDASVADALDADLCNDIANVLRIAGEKHESAHAMAIKVLNDMTIFKIPYNALTREILRATAFGDGPYDDSNLLFEVIEYPERGEISVGKKSLESVSDDILKLISNRHQTPLDREYKLLRSAETHPNLQRSPE